MTKIGELGENLVGCWLATRGWIIKYRRWRCRWGEIDLIVRSKDSDRLAFVEVKTRGIGNWDFDGLLAITPQKQAKLWQTAEFFLAKHPDLADFPCQFDVALVSYKPIEKVTDKRREVCHKIDDLSFIFDLREPIYYQGYELTLQQYIEAAFDLS